MSGSTCAGSEMIWLGTAEPGASASTPMDCIVEAGPFVEVGVGVRTGSGWGFQDPGTSRAFVGEKLINVHAAELIAKCR